MAGNDDEMYSLFFWLQDLFRQGFCCEGGVCLGTRSPVSGMEMTSATKVLAKNRLNIDVKPLTARGAFCDSLVNDCVSESLASP